VPRLLFLGTPTSILPSRFVALYSISLGLKDTLRDARAQLSAQLRWPMLGWLPRDMQLQIPERHLGLVPGGEQVDSDALIAANGGGGERAVLMWVGLWRLPRVL